MDEGNERKVLNKQGEKETPNQKIRIDIFRVVFTQCLLNIFI